MKAKKILRKFFILLLIATFFILLFSTINMAQLLSTIKTSNDVMIEHSHQNILDALDEMTGERPYKNIISPESVSSVSVQYKQNNKIFLEKQSQTYNRAIALIEDIQIYGKIFFKCPTETYNCGIHIYMKDGTTHTIWLNTTTQIFNRDISCITLDEIVYICESWRIKELYKMIVKKAIPDQLPDVPTGS